MKAIFSILMLAVAAAPGAATHPEFQHRPLEETFGDEAVYYWWEHFPDHPQLLPHEWIEEHLQAGNEVWASVTWGWSDNPDFGPCSPHSNPEGCEHMIPQQEIVQILEIGETTIRDWLSYDGSTITSTSALSPVIFLNESGVQAQGRLELILWGSGGIERLQGAELFFESGTTPPISLPPDVGGTGLAATIPVPEPSTWALALLSVALGVARSLTIGKPY